MQVIRAFLSIAILVLAEISISAQVNERARPTEWDNLVLGARFVDRFQPMNGEILSSDTWGAENVRPRYIDNGIEDRIWSYWGGNILKAEDGKYHLLVAGWLESSPKGHREWSNSHVFNAIGDNLTGPFKPRNIIGKGHNPEVYQLKDGRYVLYVIDGRYVADDLSGSWEYGKFDFNNRDRRIIAGLSNLSFAPRNDGSFLMVCRGGGIWISQDGLTEYNQLTDKRVYPDVEGRFEDPVIWRDPIQYHMIVNDWLGRIAFYLRSKDGINWVTDPGEAYVPGIAVHEDGLVEDWFKYERIKIYQDDYGRAIQANFAVIDTLKSLDKSLDNHSSKNIGIPLNPGVLLTVLNKKPITAKTKLIEVKVMGEEGFNPYKDIDFDNLRFGASEVVNFGGGSQLLETRQEGDDLILMFDGSDNGFTDKNFAGKLLGTTTDGQLLYGYSRLPGVNYNEAILSACQPRVSLKENSLSIDVEVQNFGQVASEKAEIKIEIDLEGKTQNLAQGKVKPLQPYEKTIVTLTPNMKLDNSKEHKVRVVIQSKSTTPVIFNTTTN